MHRLPSRAWLRTSLNVYYAPTKSHKPIQFLRSQATVAGSLAEESPVVSETNRAEVTLKRFWKTVGIDKQGDSFSVTLDKRGLRTPSGNKLLLPQDKLLAATLIAGEWDNQETVIKPHALPMTSIASRALDAMSDAKMRQDIRDSLISYLDTDTICFLQDEPPQLVELQKEHWLPLLEWVRSTYDVEIRVSESILLSAQSEDTKQKLRKVLDTFTSWEMAAMERATHTTKSFLIALALVKGHLSVDQAARAAQAEVDSQIQRWGEVEDSHDVDFHDVRRQLGSAACLLSTT